MKSRYGSHRENPLTLWREAVEVELRMMMGTAQYALPGQMMSVRRTVRRYVSGIAEARGREGVEVISRGCLGRRGMRQFALIVVRRWCFRCGGRTAGTTWRRRGAALGRGSTDQRWMSVGRCQQGRYAEIRWPRRRRRWQVARYRQMAVTVSRTVTRIAIAYGREWRVLIKSGCWSGVRHPRLPRYPSQPRLGTLDYAYLRFPDRLVTDDAARIVMEVVVDPEAPVRRIVAAAAESVDVVVVVATAAIVVDADVVIVPGDRAAVRFDLLLLIFLLLRRPRTLLRYRCCCWSR